MSSSIQVVKVNRERIADCMTCPLCNKLLRDATTISECLHAFCRNCIYEKLSDEELECCPVCNIDLGCIPPEKLRPDHNLQDLRAKIFPSKRRKLKVPEAVPEKTLPEATITEESGFLSVRLAREQLERLILPVDREAVEGLSLSTLVDYTTIELYRHLVFVAEVLRRFPLAEEKLKENEAVIHQLRLKVEETDVCLKDTTTDRDTQKINLARAEEELKKAESAAEEAKRALAEMQGRFSRLQELHGKEKADLEARHEREKEELKAEHEKALESIADKAQEHYQGELDRLVKKVYADAWEAGKKELPMDLDSYLESFEDDP